MEGASRALSGSSEPRARGRNLGQLRRLAGHLSPYRLQVVGAVIALAVAAASVLSLGIGVRYLIDGGFGAGREEALDHALEAGIAVIIALAASTYARAYLVAWLGERVVADLRRDVYDRVISLSPGFFEVTRTGEVLSRLTTDTTVIQTVVSSSVSQALRNMLLLTGGLVLLVITNPKLSGIVLVTVPLVVVPIVVVGRRVRALSRSAQDRLAEVSAQGEETINAVRTVQSFAQEGRERTRFAELSEAAFAAAAGHGRARAVLAASVITLVFGAIVLVLWLGGRDVLAGRISAGELSSFIFFATVVASAAGGLSEIFGDLQRAAGATERLFDLLDTTPDIAAPDNPETLPEPPRGAVAFENVNFAYPAHPGQNVLNDFDLAITPGETVALVGPSGAGKSSVFQLVLRFYDPGAGVIRFDGTDLRRLGPANLRSHIALVPQEPMIFSANAWDNIRYGRPDASDDEVRAAASAAAASEFLERLPEGFDTFLGEKGVRLSGGQRQRVAIARALLCDPALLLLDEATSSLDAENERLVQEALERIMHGRTSIVIAHRLATVLKADRIIVMEAGRVIASGRHDELLRGGGLYARLADLQFNIGSGRSVAE